MSETCTTGKVYATGVSRRADFLPMGSFHLPVKAIDDSNPLLGGGNLFLVGFVVNELYIPDGVRCVSERAFTGCGSIEAVYVPDSVERIMDRAFALCLGLKLVSLGRGLKIIEDDSFLGCFFVTDIVNLSGLDIKSGTYAGGKIGLNAKKIADGETGAPLRFTVEGGFEFMDENGKLILTKYRGDGGAVTLSQSDDIGRGGGQGLFVLREIVGGGHTVLGDANR